jgi:hypothetical protein
VDFERKVLTFQHMKIGPPMTFPMGTRLTDMLRKRLVDDEWLGTSGFGLPGQTRQDAPWTPGPAVTTISQAPTNIDI